MERSYINMPPAWVDSAVSKHKRVDIRDLFNNKMIEGTLTHKQSEILYRYLIGWPSRITFIDHFSTNKLHFKRLYNKNSI